MSEYRATFEIESSSDARTASRALDELANRLREERLVTRDGESDPQTLAAFERLGREIETHQTGRISVSYHQE